MLKLKIPLRALLAFALALPVPAFAQAPDGQTQPDAKALQGLNFCYAMASIAHLTVMQRNTGQSFEDMIAHLQKMGDTAAYKVAESITRQIYEKDLRDPAFIASQLHRSCLAARNEVALYGDSAIAECPLVGLMIAAASNLRQRGASVDQLRAALGGYFGNAPTAYEGGIEKIAERFPEGGKADTGVGDYLACMGAGVGRR